MHGNEQGGLMSRNHTHWIGGCFAVLAAGLMAAGCGGGGGTSTATLPAGATSTVSAVAATVTPAAGDASSTAAAATTGTPASSAVDPCTTMQSLEGQPLVPSVSFALSTSASTKWQICNGGAAAGSGEKYLFRTTDDGATWSLISQTTLGMPTPQSGVGALPNGNGATALFFQNANDGWLGLSSPGANFYKSTDGGMTWTEVPGVIPPAVPVRTITFSSATSGTVTTADGTWTTSDGGATWTKTP
jgi:hypothetical protein